MEESDLSPPMSPFHGYTENEVPSGVDLISSYSDMDQAVSPPLSPCFGFHESDIPESSIEVTPDDEETIENIQVVRVQTPKAGKNEPTKPTRQQKEPANKRTEASAVAEKTKSRKRAKLEEAVAAVASVVEPEKVKENKKIFLDDEDIEICHGFDVKDIPRPIVIKEEPEDVSVERQELIIEPVTTPILLHGQTKITPLPVAAAKTCAAVTAAAVKPIPMGQAKSQEAGNTTSSKSTALPESSKSMGVINFLSGSSDLTVSKTSLPVSNKADVEKVSTPQPANNIVISTHIVAAVAPGSPRPAPGSPKAAPASPRPVLTSPRGAGSSAIMKIASPLSPRGGNNIAIIKAPASPRGAGSGSAAIVKSPGSPRGTATVAIIKAPGSPRGSPGTVVRVLSPRGAGSSSPSRVTSPRVAAAGSSSPRIAAAGSLSPRAALQTSPTKIAISAQSPLKSDIGPDHLEDNMEVGISVEEVRTSDDKLSIAAMNTIARNLGPDISVKDGTPARRGRKPSQINAQTPRQKAGMTVQKIVTVPEPHKNKAHPLPVRKVGNERPIRMITKAPLDETVSQVTPPRQGQTTSTSPATRIERIVMNTTPKAKQQQQTPKMIVVTEAAEVIASEHVIGPESIITTTLAGDNTIQVTTVDSNKDKPMDALAKCIEETLVTVDSHEAVIPDIMEQEQQHQEGAATIIIRNQTQYQDDKQDSPQHNVMAVEEVEFLENVDEDSQQILVVVGEDGTEVQNLEVIQTQNIELTSDGEVSGPAGGHQDLHQQVIREEEVEGEVGEVSSGGGLERGELGEVVTDEQGNQIVFRKIEDLTRREPKNEIDKITIIETGDGPGSIKTIHSSEEIRGSKNMDRNIQIVDENGDTIVFMEKDGDSDTDSEFEDREFTVIVDDDGSDVDLDHTDLTLSRLNRIPLEEKNTFEGDTIEDILAQFEKESTNRAVACPNCKKCFVSEHYLRIHISNKVTLCDLCNTQCCTQANLRTHKNVDCDLSKRKRNIDLIAQETELLGRKPIEPEKYYNMPIDSSDEENEQIPRARIVRNVNDHKYECPDCGLYVKILSSHMKYIHNQEKIVTAKYRCPECNVFVASLSNHKDMKHNPDRTVNKLVLTTELVVVRCKHLGCDTFFNSMDELSEHVRREHGEQPRLPCGMGDCNAIFDSRGALRKHRTEVHPELEEFKPVDLEPDDPDRDADFTVVCPVCERKFKHKTTCTVHIKVHHLGWVKKKLYECQDCGKGFDNKKGLEFHREAIHLGVRTICPLCEKPVTRLDLHVRMVHSELPEFPCPDCGKRFKRKFDLNRHRVTVHLGVRNFPCDLCGKRFADMKDMTRHKNAVHYGMKIKWNSKAHKEERRKRKEVNEKKRQIQQQQLENSQAASVAASLQTQAGSRHRVSNRGFPMEFIDAEHGASLHLTEGAESLVEESVLDPMYKSVQTEDGVFIQVQDHHQEGGVRMFMINDAEEEGEEGEGEEIEDEEEGVGQEVEGEEIVMEDVKVQV